MNKTELVEFIATKANLTKSSAGQALEAFLEGVTSALQKGDPVVLVGFCTITVKQRAAREGRNPATGEKINIKASKVVGFKAGKVLKDAVKEEAVTA
ncbi:MAG TPA: HU family DNA-binding protein [Gammaproteobacteria bacterium]|jgi:DNA-binding protein HU-beta|nr:HU family DNA-binding protein [Gammaproteobacteria bacterium]